MNNSEIQFLIIDWGTTNFRALAIAENGKVLGQYQQKLGLLQVENRQFSQALAGVLSDWLGQYQHLPIYMAGMIGSAQGWVETPYVPAPLSMTDLASKAHQFSLPWGSKATLVPGGSHKDHSGSYDVMRGEEVQLFGLQVITQKESFHAVFPGTHSKHIVLDNGKLIDFSTYMTGELFSLLINHSILGRGLPEPVESHDSFFKGITNSSEPNLLNRLFSARTVRLFEQVEEPHIQDYLSGLLIGYELRSLASDSVYLVGDPLLCERYEKACQALDIQFCTIDGNHCFLEGMLQVKQDIKDE